MNTKTKTLMLIDGMTTHFSFDGKKVDYTQLKNWIDPDADAHYFNSIRDKTNFLTYLSQAGFILQVIKPIINTQIETYKPFGIDVKLTMETMKRINEYDKFIFVTGKVDFLPLIDYLVSQGKQVKIIATKTSMNKLLQKHHHIFLDKFLETQP